MFLNWMRLFQRDRSDHMEQREHENQDFQKKVGIARVYLVKSRKCPVEQRAHCSIPLRAAAQISAQLLQTPLSN